MGLLILFLLVTTECIVMHGKIEAIQWDSLEFVYYKQSL